MKTKKRYLILLLILSIFIINISNITPQELPVVGNINPDTNQPVSFEKFQQAGESLSKAQENQSYILQDWTVWAYDNSVLGPILFYTEIFFSALNPLWQLMFDIEFSWSWEFILSLILWIILIIVIYSPTKAFTNFNPFLTIIFSMIVATIAGSQGIIKTAVEIFTPFIKNIWILGILIIFAVIFAWLYWLIFERASKKMKKESEEEEIKKAKESIKAHGKVSSEALNELGKK
jgi:hypothetical protein